MDITKNKKLRKFIFERLFDELFDKTYYPYGNEVWIVDFEKQEWFFHYNSNGVLMYNRRFFDSFFRIFSLNQSEYQKLLKFWVETRINHQINHISRRNLDITFYLDGIKKSEDKKWSLKDRFGYGYGIITRYLNLKKYISEENIKLEYFLTENGVY